ncbi:MAG: hypothetical protein MJA83_00780 [Gammaproteobacteria bacterium]|nr:hypothetical protein [Gammaproteobacteria bacterium]
MRFPATAWRKRDGERTSTSETNRLEDNLRLAVAEEMIAQGRERVTRRLTNDGVIDEDAGEEARA